MAFIILFFLELLFLFLLSRELQKTLSRFFHQITQSTKATVMLLSLLFFPGTLIHELSHFTMAKLLFVKTGKINLIPHLEGQTVRMGSVTILGVDPIRRLIIGVAPFLIGTAVILTMIFLTEAYHLWTNPWIIAGMVYAVFEVGNSMFSSSKDLEGALSFVALTMIGFAAYYLLGGTIPLETLAGFMTAEVVHAFSLGSVYLAIPIVIDLLVILFLRLLLKIIRA